MCLTDVLAKCIYNFAVAQLRRLPFFFVNNKVKRKKIKFAYSKLGSVSSYVLAVACTNHSLERFLVKERFAVCFRS